MHAIDDTTRARRTTKMRRITAVGTIVVMSLLATSPALAAGGNSLNAKLCQKGGWTSLVTTTGARFANEGACVSYGAHGGALKHPQTIAFTSTSPSPAAAGGTYTPAASASSGLPVVITIDASSGSTCSKSAGGVVTFNASGTCTIDANQPGDATYNAAPQVQQSVTVVKQGQTVSFTSTNPSPATVGGTYTPTAAATSALPAVLTVDAVSVGVCSLSAGGVVTFNASGTCTLDANQLGDAAYNAALQVQQVITVTVIAPLTSPAACESQGGTFGTATSLWTCNGLPSAASDDWSSLNSHCVADGGPAAGAVPAASGGWNYTCYGAALYALLLAVGGAVAGAIYAASQGSP
jgi:hypothetical protein